MKFSDRRYVDVHTSSRMLNSEFCRTANSGSDSVGRTTKRFLTHKHPKENRNSQKRHQAFWELRTTKGSSESQKIVAHAVLKSATPGLATLRDRTTIATTLIKGAGNQTRLFVTNLPDRSRVNGAFEEGERSQRPEPYRNQVLRQ